MMAEWIHDYETIIKDWRAKAFVNMWLQLKSGYYYERINDLLTYPILVLSSVSGATIFTFDNHYTQLIIAYLSLLTVIVTGILVEVRPGEKATGHFACMRLYSSLIRNINYTISLPIELRPEPIKYINNLNDEISNITENDMIIPLFVISWFERKFGNLDRLIYGQEIVNLIEEDIKQKSLLEQLWTPKQKKRTNL